MVSEVTSWSGVLSMHDRMMKSCRRSRDILDIGECARGVSTNVKRTIEYNKVFVSIYRLSDKQRNLDKLYRYH